VILLHQSPLGDHWDVMLETDTALTTWSIPPQSEIGESFVCSATRLPDHRKHYLDYEGEVTGNRGSVVRIETGIYEQQSPEQFVLYGTHFLGILTVQNDTMTFVKTKNTPSKAHESPKWTLLVCALSFCCLACLYWLRLLQCWTVMLSCAVPTVRRGEW
jgi:hypothetical protein